MKKFIITFIVSFIVFYVLEHFISHLFNIDLHTLDFGWFGWFGFILFYGFKFHIFCCLIPLLFTSYKCRHKKCDHDHCKDHQK
jgi:hypothetical protein